MNAFEASGLNNSYSPSSGLAVDFNTGDITWKPMARGLYTTNMVGESYFAGPVSSSDKSQLKNTVAIDFLIDVLNINGLRCKHFCSNSGSVCTSVGNCNTCVENGVKLTRMPYSDMNVPPVFSEITNNGAVVPLSWSISVSIPNGETSVLVMTATDSDVEDFITM